MTKIDVQTIKKVKERAEKVVSLLGIQGKVLASAEEGKIRISVDTDDKALLIGIRGENLFALRYMVALVCREILSEGTSLSLDVGGYLEEKEKRIESIAEQAARRVKETGFEETLPEMNPYERMLAHQKVAGIKGLTSYSEGQGPSRKVIIAKESNK